MSAVPTRFEAPPAGGNALCETPKPPSSDPGFPLRAGNRVLESLARRESLPSLLAFSALHEQIQHSPAFAAGNGQNSDLVQTERFVLDEVFQLLCDRAQAITGADGVIVALSEGAPLVCRAGSGPLSVQAGVHLVPDSEVLQEALEAGRIFSLDDCAVDTRAELDLARLLGARSTVIVPLLGKRATLGVLQAFAQRPFAFSDDDIRSFDLFGELLLSALKPKDQDRRLNWLADVADRVLAPKGRTSLQHTTDIGLARLEASADDESRLPAHWNKTSGIPEKSSEPAPATVEPAIAFGQFSTTGNISTLGLTESAPDASDSDTAEAAPFHRSFTESIPDREVGLDEANVPTPFAVNLTIATNSRPGLSGVLALLAVAALFSAGVWWGIETHGASPQKSANVATPRNTQPAAGSASAIGPDHLLDPAKLDGEIASSAPAADRQLAVFPKITNVRHWSSSVGSTVVIDMEDQVPYEVHRLTSPERIYFDLHDTRLVPDLEGKSIDVSDSALTRVRVAQPVAGVTRVVLDTRNGSNFSVSMESSPYRLIVELRDSAKAQLFAPAKPIASNSPAPSSGAALLSPNAKREDDQVKAAGIGRFRIVLDAGHGGWDLGTVGRDGLLEKDLVLDVAERLGHLLKGRLGADVIFTRTNDDYLPLDQRAEIANSAQADLFVSVHANYSKLASARGVETYYTNFFSPPGSREIEKRENGSSAKPTPVALSTSELHEKIEESRHLAASVQRSLYATLAARSPGIRDRGVKDSAFVVLTGTTMPAILTEISFVSSPADERNLRSESYRQQIAEALYKGITRYEAGAHHHVKMAQVRAASTSE
jgi:N-acetylmuramoyl-L-alanine amidase